MTFYSIALVNNQKTDNSPCIFEVTYSVVQNIVRGVFTMLDWRVNRWLPYDKNDNSSNFAYRIAQQMDGNNHCFSVCIGKRLNFKQKYQQWLFVNRIKVFSEESRFYSIEEMDVGAYEQYLHITDIISQIIDVAFEEALKTGKISLHFIYAFSIVGDNSDLFKHSLPLLA